MWSFYNYYNWYNYWWNIINGDGVMKKHELEKQLTIIKRYAQHIESVTLNPSNILVVKYYHKTPPQSLRELADQLIAYVHPMKVIMVPDKINVGVLQKKVFAAYWQKVAQEVGIL